MVWMIVNGWVDDRVNEVNKESNECFSAFSFSEWKLGVNDRIIDRVNDGKSSE